MLFFGMPHLQKLSIIKEWGIDEIPEAGVLSKTGLESGRHLLIHGIRRGKLMVDFKLPVMLLVLVLTIFARMVESGCKVVRGKKYAE